MDIKVLPLGERALLIRFEATISEHTHSQVIQLLELFEQSDLPGVLEYVPAYCSITIHYDPVQLWKRVKLSEPSYRSPSQLLKQKVEVIINQFSYDGSLKQAQNQKVVEIPVCYGGLYGPDLNDVARHNGLTNEEVVHIHSSTSYLVHMLGFVPGFPYLGGMDQRIAMPRKAIPRASIAAGSVGIAGEQTGIYPLSTPGGWRIIGRTPLKLFHPDEEIPTLIQPGDRIQFVPINNKQFEDISHTVH